MITGRAVEMAARKLTGALRIKCSMMCDQRAVWAKSVFIAEAGHRCHHEI